MKEEGNSVSSILQKPILKERRNRIKLGLVQFTKYWDAVSTVWQCGLAALTLKVLITTAPEDSLIFFFFQKKKKKQDSTFHVSCLQSRGLLHRHYSIFSLRLNGISLICSAEGPTLGGMFEMNCLLSSSLISTWGTIKTNTYLYRVIQYLHNGVYMYMLD